MSKSMQMTNEQEELSRLLDEMNAGRHPQSADKETADLLAVAAFIKNAGGPIRPPQHILDQTVTNVIAALPSGQPKRSRVWMYSGALSTVACALLIIGLHFTPPWPQEIPTIPNQPLPTQAQDASPQQAGSGSSPATTAPFSQHSATEKVESPAAANNKTPATIETSPSTPPLPPVAVTPPPPVQPPPTNEVGTNAFTLTNPAPAPRSTIQADKQQLKVARAKSIAPSAVITPLSLPGKTPNSLSVDEVSGTVRQVYDQGTPSEIIVTQRTQPNGGGLPRLSAPQVVMEKADKTEMTHTVTVMLNGQEVTLEGRQTPQELQKLAESLT